MLDLQRYPFNLRLIIKGRELRVVSSKMVFNGRKTRVYSDVHMFLKNPEYSMSMSMSI